MSNQYFQFKQFMVRHDRCAMKVGTDGTLLGCWASMPIGGRRILDIGTGTGLIALIMAQRFPKANLVAIDISHESVLQARENVETSPFANRIEVVEGDVSDFQSDDLFDGIVCNPPFFEESLQCPDSGRSLARHNVTLNFHQLCTCAFRLLSENGFFSVVISVDACSKMESEASLPGFCLTRKTFVKTVERKSPKRCLIEFRKHAVSQLDISTESLLLPDGSRSQWYHSLTADFYL